MNKKTTDNKATAKEAAIKKLEKDKKKSTNPANVREIEQLIVRIRSGHYNV